MVIKPSVQAGIVGCFLLACAIGACSVTTTTPATTGTGDSGPNGDKSDAASSDGATTPSDSASSEPSAAQGKQLTVTSNCGKCHTGSAGEFAGADAPLKGTRVVPPNLTPDSETGIGDWTDEQIMAAIRAGKDDEDEELCPTMPRFSELSDNEAKSIVLYLRSLPAVKHEVPESVCPPVKSGDDDAGADDDASNSHP
jgi:mono/diheme cytochrome c family protein